MKTDFEIEFLKFKLSLREVENKAYTDELCDKNLIYIFNNYSEYRDYFLNNGFDNIDMDIIEYCKLKTTKKGKVIAYKRLCDVEIKKQKILKNYKTLVKK